MIRSESRTATLEDETDSKNGNIKNKFIEQQLKDLQKIKAITDTNISDDKFDERRVIILKNMLRMKEKENAVLREALKKKEGIYLKCTELCAFFS